jgi:hypothetical protein
MPLSETSMFEPFPITVKVIPASFAALIANMSSADDEGKNIKSAGPPTLNVE